MATRNGSYFTCDCGHESHFGYGTIREMEELSLKRRKPQQLDDSEKDQHGVEFVNGRSEWMECPRLGRVKLEWPKPKE